MFFIDSSQSYSTSAEATRRYTGGSIGGGIVAVPGGSGVQGPDLYKSFADVASTHLYVGELIQPGGAQPFGAVSDGGVEQLTWRVLSTGAIQATQGATVLGTGAPDVIRFGGDFYYVEADLILHASAGQIRIYVEGGLALDLTGLNTINPGALPSTYGWDTVKRGSSAHNYIGAHYYIGDGSVLSDRLGPIVVSRVLMAADSAVQFTPNTGSNWANVNDAPGPDDDATHNATITVGDVDVFTPAAIDTDDTLLAFQVGVQGCRTAGTATLQTAVQQGGSTDLGPAGALGTSYAETSRTAYVGTLPDGSTPLSDAGVMALTFGYQKAS